MSDTPRTDRVASLEGNWDTKALRMTGFAGNIERELAEIRKQRDMLAEALVYAQKEHEARIAIFAFDGPVISAERERLEKRLEEAKHNATTTREDTLAAVKGGVA